MGWVRDISQIWEVVAMEGKWYLSLSFWFNILAVILAVASAFGFGEFEPADWVSGVAFAIIALINLLKQFFPKANILGVKL